MTPTPTCIRCPRRRSYGRFLYCWWCARHMRKVRRVELARKKKAAERGRLTEYLAILDEREGGR